jgi:hypothetical protein
VRKDTNPIGIPTWIDCFTGHEGNVAWQKRDSSSSCQVGA